MKKLDSLKYRFGNFKLGKKCKKVTRKKCFHNLDTARFVGVIFDATTQEKYKTAMAFIESLGQKQIKVQAMAFVLNQEALNYFPQSADIQFFALNDINWSGIPNHTPFDPFVGKQFDILIDLSMSLLFPVKYLVAMSKAAFKIVSCKEFLAFADFILEVPNAKLGHFIDTLKSYLASMRRA